MKPFHVNPDTGEVSRCSARIKCAFSTDGGDENHFATHDEAIQYAEVLSEQLAEVQKTEQGRKAQLMEAYRLYGRNITPFAMEFSKDVNVLLSALRTHGFRPLLAGGAVRDAVSSRHSGEAVDFKDLDFEAYSTDPQNTEETVEKLAAAASTVGTVDEVGKSFGVLKMTLKDGTEIDLSLPRRESKTGTGHTGFDVVPDATLGYKEASARRDFTLNSMMYDDEHGVIIDPHNGLDDLKNKRLRHTSEAFAEDPLRVLRGFQFTSRFGLNLDPNTVKLSRKLFSEYDTISTERIQTEWNKWATKGTKPSSGLKTLRDTGWDKAIPGFAEANDDATGRAVDRAAELADTHGLDRRTMLPAVVAHHIKHNNPKVQRKQREHFLRQSVIGSKEQRKALGLARSVDTEDNGRKISDIRTTADAKTAALDTRTSLKERYCITLAVQGSESSAEHLEDARRVIDDAGVWEAPEKPLMSGDDLLSLTDRKPGRWAGQVLAALKTEQARGVFSTKSEGIARAEELLKDIE